MKRSRSIFSFANLAIVAGFVFMGCNGGDYNSKEVDTPAVSDSGVKTIPMTADTASHPTMNDSASHPMMSDSSMINRNKDSAKKSSINKAKKTKVTIVLPKPRNSGSMDIDKEGYYSNVEIFPSYPGGQRALEKFFEDNIVYPDPASENGTEGTVTLNFVVDEKGKVFNPMVAGKKIGDGIEEEAIRVFNKMPAWTPGKIKGNNVKTRYTLPITFQLD